MTITRQLALTLPGVDEQLDIFAILPTELAGHAAEWSTPARDLTTWQGMAEELADVLELLDRAEEARNAAYNAVMAGGIRTMARLEAAARRAAISDLTEGTPRYSRRFAHLIAKDALAMSNAWGVEQ